MRYFFIISILTLSINSFAQSNWTEIKTTEIPDTISTQIISDYAKYEIIKSAKKLDKVGNLIFRIDIQKKRRLYHLIYSKEGMLKDKSKSKVFEYDGSEKNRKPSDGSHQMEPPRLPSM